eukprot:gene26225-11959_t
MASTASVKDLERWKAAGGTVQKPTKGKGSVQTFVSPGGEKLKSWQDAEKLLSKADETPQDTKSGKGRAAQISYKEKSSYRESKSDRIVTSDDVKCESEAHALEQTGGKSTIKRRLQDFNVEDASGQLVPLDRIHLMKEDVFASAPPPPTVTHHASLIVPDLCD